MRDIALSLATLPLALAACDPMVFECPHNRACNMHDGGICVRDHGRCAYPAPTCDARLRFGPYAGERANRCVPALADDLVIAWPAPKNIAIDGDPSEFRMGRPLRLESNFGLQGDLWFAWDEHALYVAADVRDPNVQGGPITGTRLWDRDGIEILFDTNADGDRARLPRADDFKFLVTAVNATATWWGGISPEDAWDTPLRSATRVLGTLDQGTDRDAGYGVELMIPWSDPFPRPSVGQRWGMNIKLNDQLGGNARTVPWRPGTFNFPAHAGRLGFAGRDLPTSFVAPRAGHPSESPKYTRLDLAAAWRGASAPFEPDTPPTNLFDGCVGLTPGCTATVRDADSVTLEFDLGQIYELGYARLFGDDRHEWVSESWSLEVARDPQGPWRQVFAKEPALGLRWFTRDVRGTEARFVRVSVHGRPGMGLELKELELYGRAPARVAGGG